MKLALTRLQIASYVRAFIFGVEDSLVSTGGLIAGIASGGLPRSSVVLTSIVLIFVEAFSMSAGSFLSEGAASEYMNRKEMPLKLAIIGSLIMFASYFISGFIPLAPYLFLETKEAFWLSIFLSLITLFILGLISGKLFKINYWKSAFRMIIIGGIAIAVGVLVGELVPNI